MVDMLTSLFKPFFGWDIAGTYMKAHAIIDFVLYLFIFLYITRYAISKRFEGETAKSLSWVIAIVFTIGMSVASAKWGFQLGNLGPLAGLILFSVLGLITYNLLKSFGAGSPSAGAFAFLLTYFTLKIVASKFFDFFEGLGNGIVGTVLSFMMWLAVIIVISGFLSSAHSGIKGSGGWNKTINTGKNIGRFASKTKKVVFDKFKKLKENYDKRKEKIKKVEDKIKKLNEKIDGLIQYEDKNLDSEEMNSRSMIEQIEYLNQEKQALEQSEAILADVGMQIKQLRTDNQFNRLDKQINQLLVRYQDNSAKYSEYGDTILKRLNWINTVIKNQEKERWSKNLIKDSEEIMDNLKKDIKFLGQDHILLVAAYNNAKNLVMYGNIKGTIGPEEKRRLAEDMKVLAEKITNIIKDEKSKIEILEEEEIALKARKMIGRDKRIEKAIVKSLIKITKNLNNNINKRSYLRRKKIKSDKEVKELQKLKEKYLKYKEGFRVQLNKLYKVEIKDKDLHNKIKLINNKIKIMEHNDKIKNLNQVKGEFHKVFFSK